MTNACIPVTTKLRRNLLASAAVLAGGLWGTGALAAPITVDLSGLSALDGSQGTGAVVVNADLSLSALSNISSGLTGEAGAVYIGTEGAGVRAWEINEKKGTAGVKGSNAISGEGGHALEALVLMFTDPIAAASLQIGLNEYEYGCEKGKGKDATTVCGYVFDELTLILEDSLGVQVSFDSSIIEGLFPVGPDGFMTPLIDLSNAVFAAGLAGLQDLSKAYVRADDPGHFFVKSVTYSLGENGNGPGPSEISAPAGITLMGLGLAGAGIAMRRRRQKR